MYSELLRYIQQGEKSAGITHARHFLPERFFSEEPFSDGGGEIPCLGLCFCPLTSIFSLPQGLPQKSSRFPIEEAER